MKYIDKYTIVVEIEKIRRIEVTNNDVVYNEALDEIRYFLDTLEVKDANMEQETENPFKPGDEVIIHCGTKRQSKIRFELFNGKVGTILYIGKLETNPWGNIGVTIDGGYNDAFYIEELELVPKEE